MFVFDPFTLFPAAAGGGGNGLLDGLISYWKFDEASGNALDAHGANPLTQNGTVGSTTGKIGTARSSANQSNYFSSTSAALRTASLSISFWTRIITQTEYDCPIICSNGFSWDKGWGLYTLQSPNKLLFFAGNYGITVESAFSLNTIYHYLATFNTTTKIANLYQNGSLVDSDEFTGVTIDYSACNFRVLYGGSGVNPNMWIDEVCLWDRELDSDDAIALFGAGAGLDYGSFD